MPTSRITSVAAVGALIAATGAPALAHHSFAMFDSQKSVTLQGTIKDFQWTNPHSWIYLMVKDSTGNDVEWGIEGGGPNGLARFGWTRSSLKPGDKAVIVIHPLRDGTSGGQLVTVSVNGQRIGGS
jgi:hypothetical protein